MLVKDTSVTQTGSQSGPKGSVCCSFAEVQGLSPAREGLGKHAQKSGARNEQREGVRMACQLKPDLR